MPALAGQRNPLTPRGWSGCSQISNVIAPATLAVYALNFSHITYLDTATLLFGYFPGREGACGCPPARTLTRMAFSWGSIRGCCVSKTRNAPVSHGVRYESDWLPCMKVFLAVACSGEIVHVASFYMRVGACRRQRPEHPAQVEPTNLFWVYIATLVAAVWYNYGAHTARCYATQSSCVPMPACCPLWVQLVAAMPAGRYCTANRFAAGIWDSSGVAWQSCVRLCLHWQ